MEDFVLGLRMQENWRKYKMDWRGHLGVGFVLIGVLLYLSLYKQIIELDFIKILLLIPLILIYSLVPDLDAPASKIRYFFWIFGIIAFGILAYLKEEKLIYFLIAAMIFITLTKHRGIMHTFMMGIVFSVPFYFTFGITFSSFLLAAYTLHLVVDYLGI